jgi:ABC-type multidrug transport system permease subunit
MESGLFAATFAANRPFIRRMGGRFGFGVVVRAVLAAINPTFGVIRCGYFAPAELLDGWYGMLICFALFQILRLESPPHVGVQIKHYLCGSFK